MVRSVHLKAGSYPAFFMRKIEANHCHQKMLQKKTTQVFDHLCCYLI